MGKLESEARRRRGIGQVQKAVLATVAVGGILAVGVVAPNALQLLGGQRNKYRFNNQTKLALARLAQKGYIIFEERGGGRYARLTEIGERALTFEKQKAVLQLGSRKRWDKRWRVVIFDIPEFRRSTRDRLRKVMVEAGFYRLQDSVWLYPHDCEDFVALLKADLKIGNAVLYMIVEKIENDLRLKQHFGFS
jgi:DNA-binding transcriptional regulator PaaX